MKFSFYQATNSRDDTSEFGGGAVKREAVGLQAMVSDEVDFDERDETSEKVVEEENRVEEAGEEDDATVEEDDKRDEGMELCNVSTYDASAVDYAACVEDDAAKCNTSEVVLDDDAFESPIERVASNDSVDYDASDSPIERVESNDSMESNSSIQSKASEISHKLETIMLDRIAAIDQIRNLLETELENGKIMYCAYFIHILNRRLTTNAHLDVLQTMTLLLNLRGKSLLWSRMSFQRKTASRH
jgi:hypothetical protein